MARKASRPPSTAAPPPALAGLIGAPLANPLGHFIPGGKPKRAKRRTAEEQLALFGDLPAQQRLSRNARTTAAKLRDRAQMLDHYARTDVSLSAVAKHCGITEEEARAELARRNRHV